jgi:microcystin degradation protein MlrC
MTRRILLGGLFHETHTFLEDVTGPDQMRTREGAALMGRRGDASTVDGFLEVAERRAWTVVPTLETQATPSGTIDHAVFEAFWTKFEAVARPALAAGIDGIWLALHGAMVTTQSDDPEGDLLERIRALPGAAMLPLFAVFDLHANFTPRMARSADGLVGYRENPHADARDAAVLSAELLARSLDTGVRPRMVSR